MVDQVTFAREVQEALDHLYDPAALQVHPLTELLAPYPTEAAGHALYRVLREALSLLKPPADAPHHSPAWRSFRYLELRYVELLTMDQVADELGISTRQCRRDHHDAIRAISSILWDQYQRRKATVGAPPLSESSRVPTVEEPPDRALVVQEVGRIGTGVESATGLGAVVAGVVSTVGALAAQKRCTVIVEPTDDVPDVRADRTVLRQVLVELLLLAVDHGARGSVNLRWRLAESAVQLGITIHTARDPAPSLPFDPADPRLTVARHLAEIQGMILRVELDADPPVIRLAVPAVHTPKVLVVDDNADVIRLFRRYLEGRYDVLEARSGERAVDEARKTRPALITLDVMMPSQDGWEVLQILKQDPSTARIPVVVCSVLRERELALSLGAADFLTKPVLGPALLQSVERFLASR